MIAAIETVYAGCRFRSRLEARWAVFLDRMGVEWRYEPQGWAMSDGTEYLPDFWLPRVAVNVEVKGSDEQLAKGLPKIESYVRESNGLILILGEVPRVDHHVPVHPTIGMCDGKLTSLSSLFLMNGATAKWDLVRLLAAMKPTTEPAYLGGLTVSSQVSNAYYAARSARFEHGETPKRGEVA